MADVVAQLLIDGSDVFKTTEEEVEELKHQGVLSYVLTEWEPTSYFVAVSNGKSGVLEWNKFVGNINFYFVGIEVTQGIFFDVIIISIMNGSSYHSSVDVENNPFWNTVIVLLITVLANYGSRLSERVADAYNKARDRDIENMSFEQFEAQLGEEYEKNMVPPLWPCICCGCHKPTKTCRGPKCWDKRPLVEKDHKFAIEMTNTTTGAKGCAGNTIGLALVVVLVYFVSHYSTLLVFNLSTSVYATPYGNPWQVNPGNYSNKCGDDGLWDGYTTLYIQNRKYGWCAPMNAFSGCVGTDENPFDSKDFPPKGLVAKDITTIDEECASHNQASNPQDQGWDNYCYLKCTTDADCGGGSANDANGGVRGYQNGGMTCQPMWRTDSSYKGCGSICAYQNVTATMPAEPTAVDCQPLGSGCPDSVTTPGSLGVNFAISMMIVWGQGLATVIVLFYCRVYCCSREGKEARDKLLNTGPQDSEDSLYGSTNAASPYD